MIDLQRNRSRCLAMVLALSLGMLLAGQEWVHVRNVPMGEHPLGTRVSMDQEGDVLIIGLSSDNGGVVRVHKRNEEGLGQWGVVQELTSSDPRFGHAVAISGASIAIGAPGTGADGAFTGAVLLGSLSTGVGDPLVLRDTLFGQAAGDRFGYALSWSGDTLVTSSVGRSQDRFTGGVSLVRVLNGQVVSTEELPARWQDLQLPFTRWFGASLAIGQDRMAVAAPFSGFRADVDQQNVGALFVYERSDADPEWTLDTVWYETNSAVAGGCTFDRIELGRGGLHFTSGSLVFEHRADHTGVPGGPFAPWQTLGDELHTSGCAPCGLHIVEQGSDGWSFATMVTTHQDAGWDRIAERGWTTEDDLLYVSRTNSSTGVWATTVHQRDADGPGQWGTMATIDALDPCDRLVGPIDVNGDDLMRVAAQGPGDCGVGEGVQKLVLQVFAR